jgi:hypothetical protein
MSSVLAQIDLEQVGALFGACVLALGGWRGIEHLILAWRGRLPRGEAPAEGTCLDHRSLMDSVKSLVQTQHERDERNERTFAEIRESIGIVHRRVDALYTQLTGGTNSTRGRRKP